MVCQLGLLQGSERSETGSGGMEGSGSHRCYMPALLASPTSGGTTAVATQEDGLVFAGGAGEGTMSQHSRLG